MRIGPFKLETNVSKPCGQLLPFSVHVCTLKQASLDLAKVRLPHGLVPTVLI